MSKQSEKINFTYESVGNLCKLLLTIQYEKSHTPREITVFHQRFQGKQGDDLVEKFLTKLFPEGANIGLDEINRLVAHTDKFLSEEKTSQDLFVDYDKRVFYYYVYFKPYNKVYECDFAKHEDTVIKLCCDYFKGYDIDKLDPLYLKNFILNNFELASDNTDIRSIAKDYKHIWRCLYFDDD